MLLMLAFRTVVLSTILLFTALAAGPYVAVQYDYIGGHLPLGWFKYFGVLLILFGLPLSVWSAYLLLMHGRDHSVPYNLPPYKYIRNPFMLGWLFVLWGEVIFFRCLPLLIYAIVLTLCVHFWVIAYEEPFLEDKYHDEYRRYKASVPRWIPKLRKKSQCPNPNNE